MLNIDNRFSVLNSFKSSMEKVNEGSATALDFNQCKSLFRLYCSYGSKNSPLGGGYYWGVFNVGWNDAYFIQFACMVFNSSSGRARIWVRPFFDGTTWGSWSQIYGVN